MKKICFAIRQPDYTNGITRVVINLINEISNDRNYDITILSMKEIIDDSEFTDKINSNIKIQTLNLSYYSNKRILVTAIPKLISFFNNNDFDKVIISAMESIIPYFAGYYLSKNRSTKLAAWEHRNFMAGPILRLEWIGKRIALKFFSDVVTITKKDYNRYITYSDKENIHQVYNLGKYEGISKNYSTYNSKIISVGYLSYIKGYDMLIQVAAKVFEKHSDWTWDIYGEGESRADIENGIKKLNLENKLFLKGQDPKVNTKYNQYGMFVFTSRAEGMGMVLIEAQKAGLPVISFDILCGPSDVISDEINGYLIEPFDIEKMAQKIIYLIDHPEVRIDFSDNSIINHKEFEKEFIINKWKENILN